MGNEEDSDTEDVASFEEDNDEEEHAPAMVVRRSKPFKAKRKASRKGSPKGGKVKASAKEKDTKAVSEEAVKGDTQKLPKVPVRIHRTRSIQVIKN